ncbi:hypothetical protein EVAR_55981_1 [Eumeta japonica]|uniref:Uncharacterized protein n=1 Tax=Eumeta variegata TaxID=151549 RepID=A0A4C1YA69_EUMVA|nr:hypothetical protein EVAR_55981_1 [Eumeta japonica]
MWTKSKQPTLHRVLPYTDLRPPAPERSQPHKLLIGYRLRLALRTPTRGDLCRLRDGGNPNLCSPRLLDELTRMESDASRNRSISIRVTDRSCKKKDNHKSSERSGRDAAVAGECQANRFNLSTVDSLGSMVATTCSISYSRCDSHHLTEGCINKIRQSVLSGVVRRSPGLPAALAPRKLLTKLKRPAYKGQTGIAGHWIVDGLRSPPPMDTRILGESLARCRPFKQNKLFAIASHCYSIRRSGRESRRSHFRRVPCRKRGRVRARGPHGAPSAGVP